MDRVLGEVDALLRSSGVIDETSTAPNHEAVVERLGSMILEESDRRRENELFVEIGAISSGLAHDLRGPLQTIRNCTYLLVSEPDKEELLDEINGAVQHINRMLDGFREYYRGHEITKTGARIDRIIDTALRDVVIPPGVELVKILYPGIDTVDVDPPKLAGVIRNLVRSAINGMPDGGTLTVATVLRGERFAIIVRDTGPSITEADQETLFTPFGYKKRDGDGLTLPGAFRVVKAHGGDVTFETDPENGSTCTLVLPLSR